MMKFLMGAFLGLFVVAACATEPATSSVDADTEQSDSDPTGGGERIGR